MALSPYTTLSRRQRWTFAIAMLLILAAAVAYLRSESDYWRGRSEREVRR